MASHRRVGAQLTEVVSGGTTPTNGANIADVLAASSSAVPGAVVTGASSGSTNLGSFSAGVLQQTVSTGVATVSTLTMVTGQIPFGLSSGLLGQDGGLNWDNVNKRLGVGTAVPSASIDVAQNSATVSAIVRVVNSSVATGPVSAEFGASNGGGQALRLGTMGVNSLAHTAAAPNLIAGMTFVLSYFTNGLYLGSPNTISMQTGATQVERLKIDILGNISMSSLSASGVVHAATTTGQLSVGTVNTTDITPAAVDNTKLATMVTARFKARVTAGTGAPEDITGTQATTLLDTFTSTLKGLAGPSGGGTANFLRADGVWTTPSGTTDGDKGDIVVSSGSTVWTIDVGVVDNTKLATMATARFKGRVTAGTGSPEDLTGTQATTLLDVFTPTLKGLAPASGGGTSNFLRADGTWVLPPGFALTDGDKGDIVVSGSGTSWTIDTNAVTATKIADHNVTFAKLEQLTAGKLIGFDGPGTGDAFDISVVAPLTMVPGNGQLTFATGFTPGSVVFQGSAQIAQDNANFFWNDTNNRLGIGTNVPITDFNVHNNVNGSTQILVDNQGAGITALAQFVASNSPGGGIGIAVGVAGSGFTATTNRPLVIAGMPYVVPYFGSQNLYVGAPSTLIFATGTPEATRLQILVGGQINISSLSASGVVQAATSTGQLSVTTMVAGQIPFGAPSGGGLAQDAGLVYDNINKRLGVGASISSPGFDLSVAHTTNTSTNVAVENDSTGTLATSQFIASNNNGVIGLFGATGSGYTATLARPNLAASTMFITPNNGLPLYIGAVAGITFQSGSPHAEAMRVLSTGEVAVFTKLTGGNTAARELVLAGTSDGAHPGHVMSLDPFGIGRSAGVLGGAPMFAVAGNVSVNSGASASLDWAVFNTPTITIVGSTNITNAAGFNFFTINPPIYSGTIAIGAGGFAPPAATLVIAGAPSVSGGASFNNGASLGPLGLWVKASSQIDGSLNLSNNLNMNGTLNGNNAVFIGNATVNGTLAAGDIQGITGRSAASFFVGTSPTWAINATVDVGPSNPRLGFYSATPITQRNITGSRTSGVALTNLLAGLAQTGLIQDSTTA